MIKIDIDMPKGCWTCPYFRSNWNKPRCTAKSQAGRKILKYWNLGDTRKKWCPLIEVKK